MYQTVKPNPHHLGYATGIVAVGLVDLRLQHSPHVRIHPVKAALRM
jgi:hypothetical protein